jgi:hypothetical protein
MPRRTGSLVVAALVLAQLLALAPAGRASVVLEFSCSGMFSSWPTNSASTSCNGSARTANTAGTICFAGCSFFGTFEASGSDCSVPGFGPFNSYWLHTGSDSYQAHVVGVHVTYYKGAVPVGEGELLPQFPLPNCSAVGSLGFTLTGRIVKP